MGSILPLKLCRAHSCCNGTLSSLSSPYPQQYCSLLRFFSVTSIFIFIYLFLFIYDCVHLYIRVFLEQVKRTKINSSDSCSKFPVPLQRRRLRTVGFRQSSELCEVMTFWISTTNISSLIKSISNCCAIIYFLKFVGCCQEFLSKLTV